MDLSKIRVERTATVIKGADEKYQAELVDQKDRFIYSKKEQNPSFFSIAKSYIESVIDDNFSRGIIVKIDHFLNDGLIVAQDLFASLEEEYKVTSFSPDDVTLKTIIENYGERRVIKFSRRKGIIENSFKKSISPFLTKIVGIPEAILILAQLLALAFDLPKIISWILLVLSIVLPVLLLSIWLPKTSSKCFENDANLLVASLSKLDYAASKKFWNNFIIDEYTLDCDIYILRDFKAFDDCIKAAFMSYLERVEISEQVWFIFNPPKMKNFENNRKNYQIAHLEIDRLPVEKKQEIRHINLEEGIIATYPSDNSLIYHGVDILFNINREYNKLSKKSALYSEIKNSVTKLTDPLSPNKELRLTALYLLSCFSGLYDIYLSLHDMKDLLCHGCSKVQKLSNLSTALNSQLFHVQTLTSVECSDIVNSILETMTDFLLIHETISGDILYKFKREICDYFLMTHKSKLPSENSTNLWLLINFLETDMPIPLYKKYFYLTSLFEVIKFEILDNKETIATEKSYQYLIAIELLSLFENGTCFIYHKELLEKICKLFSHCKNKISISNKKTIKKALLHNTILFPDESNIKLHQNILNVLSHKSTTSFDSLPVFFDLLPLFVPEKENFYSLLISEKEEPLLEYFEILYLISQAAILTGRNTAVDKYFISVEDFTYVHRVDAQENDHNDLDSFNLPMLIKDLLAFFEKTIEQNEQNEQYLNHKRFFSVAEEVLNDFSTYLNGNDNNDSMETIILPKALLVGVIAEDVDLPFFQMVSYLLLEMCNLQYEPFTSTNSLFTMVLQCAHNPRDRQQSPTSAHNLNLIVNTPFGIDLKCRILCRILSYGSFNDAIISTWLLQQIGTIKTWISKTIVQLQLSNKKLDDYFVCVYILEKTVGLPNNELLIHFEQEAKATYEREWEKVAVYANVLIHNDIDTSISSSNLAKLVGKCNPNIAVQIFALYVQRESDRILILPTIKNIIFNSFSNVAEKLMGRYLLHPSINLENVDNKILLTYFFAIKRAWLNADGAQIAIDVLAKYRRKLPQNSLAKEITEFLSLLYKMRLKEMKDSIDFPFLALSFSRFLFSSLAAEGIEPTIPHEITIHNEKEMAEYARVLRSHDYILKNYLTVSPLLEYQFSETQQSIKYGIIINTILTEPDLQEKLLRQFSNAELRQRGLLNIEKQMTLLITTYETKSGGVMPQETINFFKQVKEEILIKL